MVGRLCRIYDAIQLREKWWETVEINMFEGSRIMLCNGFEVDAMELSMATEIQ